MEPKQNNFIIFLLSSLLIVSCLIAGFFAWKTQQLVSELRVVSNELKPTPVATQTPDPTTDWKTYSNKEFGFEFKYPTEFAVDLEKEGFISGSNYYGKRDLNVLVYDPKIEPSHTNEYADDKTGQSFKTYDGYNFAIFSGNAKVNHLNNLDDLVSNGPKYSPPMQTTEVIVKGQKHQLYYFPPSNLPNTMQIEYWQMSFDLDVNYTIIISGNYDQKLLSSILTTFKVIEPTTSSSSLPIACTMEAKICPDGSAVGRSGPKCEFEACPTALN